jgi:DNA-binding NtrC family response regulator
MTPQERDPGIALLCDTSLPSEDAFEAASPVMRAFGRLLANAARHSVPVLLFGERGTGKTTFARALHAMSSRAARPFVRVDCPAAGDLSTEAHAARRGTLFFDEVAGLSPPLQAAALRFVEDVLPLPFRLVASTCHDLEAEMTAGRFRKDLFYRLDVLEIRIPPLRERAEDILPIARAFVASLVRSDGRPPPQLSPALERALLAHSWPGNVQELLGVLQRMLILSTGGPLDVGALPDRIMPSTGSVGS